ncbi:hypothetical protein HPP92_019572 [Vanilla planifolia]|uniref:Uncharacterized protein n=1 Tax=Vanilla planifolia TaxID=51239 RepID=A0A835Q6Q3_VANPL|nr:hypothetical protein HPP92_019572 [Vanilla planifolia]
MGLLVCICIADELRTLLPTASSMQQSNGSQAMEDLRPDSGRSLAKPEEDDEFYEDIEAPKFVDFTTPDQSRLDNRSWFCLRVGCDQSHEEVDHEELYRSFKIRVMAARSPNIRFQRAFQQGSRYLCIVDKPCFLLKSM